MSEVPPSSQGSQKRSRRRNRPRKPKLAVDQHLAKALLAKLSTTQLNSGNEDIPAQRPGPSDSAGEVLPESTRQFRGESTKYFCNICRVICSSRKNLDQHVSGKRHAVFRALENNRFVCLVYIQVSWLHF